MDSFLMEPPSGGKNSEDQYQNEIWTTPGPLSNDGKWWIETGETIGQTRDFYTSTPVYFWAVKPPGYNFASWYLPNGPRLNEIFWLYTRAAGGGVWCAIIDSTQLGCQGSFGLYASATEAGLEAAVNTPPDTVNNSGYTALFYQKTNGENHAVEVAKTNVPTPGVTWCYKYPFNYLNKMEFTTKKAPCPSGYKQTSQSGDVVAGGDGLDLSESPMSQKSSLTAMGQPEPAEGYVEPSGAELNSAQLHPLVQELASQYNEGGNEAKSVTAYNMKLSEAQRAMEPQMSSPTSSVTTGMSNWLGSGMDFVVLKGKFTLTNAPTPKNASAPSGSILEVALDAHTGRVDGIAVGAEAPTASSLAHATETAAW
jgi:hypothetical protein